MMSYPLEIQLDFAVTKLDCNRPSFDYELIQIFGSQEHSKQRNDERDLGFTLLPSPVRVCNSIWQ